MCERERGKEGRQALTSLSSRFSIPFSANSLDSSNFSRARVSSSSVMFDPEKKKRSQSCVLKLVTTQS